MQKDAMQKIKVNSIWSHLTGTDGCWIYRYIFSFRTLDFNSIDNVPTYAS